MKCVNCPNNAEYTLADKGANPISYCPICLPPHLQVRALSGSYHYLVNPQVPLLLKAQRRLLRKLQVKQKLQKVL